MEHIKFKIVKTGMEDDNKSVINSFLKALS